MKQVQVAYMFSYSNSLQKDPRPESSTLVTDTLLNHTQCYNLGSRSYMEADGNSTKQP